METRKRKTNLLCVNSGFEGECNALKKPHNLCAMSTCPFFKSERSFRIGEAKAQKRCKSLGIEFLSREKVMDEMYRVTVIQKRRYEKEKRNG